MEWMWTCNATYNLLCKEHELLRYACSCLCRDSIFSTSITIFCFRKFPKNAFICSFYLEFCSHPQLHLFVNLYYSNRLQLATYLKIAHFPCFLILSKSSMHLRLFCILRFTVKILNSLKSSLTTQSRIHCN